MKKNKIILALSLAFLSSFTYAKNMNDYVEYLNKNNLDIQKAELNLNQAKLNYNGAQIDKNPSLSTSLTANKGISTNTTNPTTSYGISSSLSYDLDLWGKLKDNEKSKLLQVESLEQTLIETKRQTYYKFIDNYLQLTANNKKIEIENDKLTKYKEKLNIINTQYKNGYVTIEKLLSIKNSITETENSIIALNDIKNNLVNSLNVLLNQKTGESILDENEITDEDIQLSNEEENILIAIEKNPSVKSALLNEMSYDKIIKYNEKSYYPTITLGGSLSESALKISNLLSNPIWTILSSINVNFNYNEIKNNIEISKNNKEIAKNSYQSTYLGIFNNVKETTLKYQNAVSSLTKFNDELENNRKTLNIYKTQYNNGYLLYSNVLDQEIVVLNNEENKLTYQLTQRQMKNKLNYYIGK